MSIELLEKMNELLVKAPENRHSYFQLKHFILGKEPTTQAQLWQCLKQLQAKKETIENITLQIEDHYDEIELVQINIKKLHLVEFNSTIKDDLLDKEIEIKIKKLKRKEISLLNNVNSLEKKLQFEYQEARFYVQVFGELEKIEKMKDYDDYEAQKEYWEAKISEEINLRILTRQPLDPDLLKTALSLHEGSGIKAQTLGLIESYKKSLEKNGQKQIN